MQTAIVSSSLLQDTLLASAHMGGDGKCDACSGKLSRDGAIERCQTCGGVHGHEDDLPVDLNQPMQADCADPRYFSMTTQDGDSLHGWYDPSTGRVVQIG